MMFSMIPSLTGIVEMHCKCKVTWDIGYIYRAYDSTTGKLVATYNTITDELKILNEKKRG